MMVKKQNEMNRAKEGRVIKSSEKWHGLFFMEDGTIDWSQLDLKNLLFRMLSDGVMASEKKNWTEEGRVIKCILKF